MLRVEAVFATRHFSDLDSIAAATANQSVAMPATIKLIVCSISSSSRGGDDADENGLPDEIRNQIEYAYDSWGNLRQEWQSHAGAVDTGSTPSVQYLYEDGAAAGKAKYVRLAELVYPSGRTLECGCGTAGAIDDIMSRVKTIGTQGEATEHARYSYLGAGMVVAEDYRFGASDGVKLDYDPAGDNSFVGFDRFGRVVDQIWAEYGSNAGTRDRFKYTYDEAGNRTGRTNELHTAVNEIYQYDLLDRLTNATRADAFDQTWTLDGLGNFSAFDDDGTSQTRTANEANEITGISSGVTPAYDAAGNMISGPKTGAPATRLHYVFDAWNRMTAAYLDDGDGAFEPEGPNAQDKLIANYRYDGANRRIAKELFDTSSGDPTGSTHFYHNAAWQVLEERLYAANSSLTTAYQNVWSPRYIDAMILRDKLDTSGGVPGAIQLPDRLLYTCDANFNVTGLLKQVNGTWQVVERYLYDAYGKTTFLDRDWAPTVVPGYADGTASAFSNSTLYTGRYRDLETLLFYYRFRYYDVTLSRFIGRDPIGYRGGLSLYCYVGNSPVLYVDPFALYEPPVLPARERSPLYPGYQGIESMAEQVRYHRDLAEAIEATAKTAEVGGDYAAKVKTTCCTQKEHDALVAATKEACWKVHAAWWTLRYLWEQVKADTNWRSPGMTMSDMVSEDGARREFYLKYLGQAADACFKGTIKYRCAAPDDKRCSAARETSLFTQPGWGQLSALDPMYVCPIFFKGSPSRQATDVAHEFGRRYALIWENATGNHKNDIAMWDSVVNNLSAHFTKYKNQADANE